MVQESWAAHTGSGYYIGNAWEHYRCHKVYISDTKHSRICETVFFKHKYLTMPSTTPADALIKAADNLVDTISGLIPQNGVTADAPEQFMEICKIQAKKATCEAQTQSVLREQAKAQRVEEQQLAVGKKSSPQHSPMSLPDIEVHKYPNLDLGTLQGTPIISQVDKEDISPPSANTRQQCQTCTLTQDYLLHMMEIPGYEALFTPQQAMS